MSGSPWCLDTFSPESHQLRWWDFRSLSPVHVAQVEQLKLVKRRRSMQSPLPLLLSIQLTDSMNSHS